MYSQEDRRPQPDRQSGGNRRGQRDARRGYEHMDRREQIKDWSYQPPPYDPSREKTSRKPNPRSSAFKQKIEEPRAAKINAAKRPSSTTETPPRDEPLYDIGPHSTMVSIQDVHVQNFELSGFIPLIEETYEKLRAIDPRFLERMPLSLFTHVCCNHLNLQVAEIARQNGQNVLNARTDLRDALPDYQCLPLPIVDYITHISNVLTPNGVEVKLNLPQIAIPQGPINNVAAGSFGPVNALTHNV